MILVCGTSRVHTGATAHAVGGLVFMHTPRVLWVVVCLV